MQKYKWFNKMKDYLKTINFDYKNDNTIESACKRAGDYSERTQLCAIIDRLRKLQVIQNI